ncbi:LEA domain-containing protein [Schizosaccharomyces japonicus yFS275]|uniref:LEA domain-containing protein n=1 Tax=Schizosaccharomyces japonicus (strain yFS275 / FY16936) TaxID=402676 RepID=B6K568_SCHJY|nr:LEA domain-containing protein [Schizosaccharomyces japonicus yFS275]EEB08672.1 LEA domain-containing protein [Schizosaccharomyces japonicus yFS275]
MRIAVFTFIVAAIGILYYVFVDDRHYKRWDVSTMKNWLDTHAVPYKPESSAKDLRHLVGEYMEAMKPNYEEWSTSELKDYLNMKEASAVYHGKKGLHKAEKQVNKAVDDTKSAANRVKDYASDKTKEGKESIFDSWNDSQLKKFLERHGALSKKETSKLDALSPSALREKAHDVYKKASGKFGDAEDWVFESWTDSDLKNWLDEHKVHIGKKEVPRESLVKKVKHGLTHPGQTLKDSFAAAREEVEEDVHSTKAFVEKEMSGFNHFLSRFWSYSRLKKFLDMHGVPTIQLTEKDRLLARIRRLEYKTSKNAEHAGKKVADKMRSATSQAKEKAGDMVENAKSGVKHFADETVIGKWQDSKLKSFLDARGIPVPQPSTKDELIALVRRNLYKLPLSSWNIDFDKVSSNDLSAWIKKYKSHYTGKLHPSQDREHLVQNARNIYGALVEKGDNIFNEASKAIRHVAVGYSKWSDDDLKSALKEYGEKVHEPFDRDEAIRRLSRNDYVYSFHHAEPHFAMFGKLKGLMSKMFGLLTGSHHNGKRNSKVISSKVPVVVITATTTVK